MDSTSVELLPLEENIAAKIAKSDSAFKPYGVNDNAKPDYFLYETGKCWLGEQSWHALPSFAHLHSEVPRAQRDEIAALENLDDDEARQHRIKNSIVSIMHSMGYPGNFPGGVALFSDIFLGRILQNVINPYIGVACIRWAGAHSDFSPGNVVKDSWKMADEWESNATRRPLIESQIKDFAQASYRIACESPGSDTSTVGP